ncbi:MAG: AAA family ATPase [Candidatus Rokubacteria bacterium]|nr:AAA family ATPase [Candidatus Rokubacteria bacterium]
MRAVMTGAPVYLTYFGLAEAPFSTTPDQRFLYLSERHRDGVAHLLYGIAERGGFVQLTGEVGTGKTTLCRHLLENLPEHVDVALILNPTLTRLELLATICDELRVPYPADATSVKPLVDALYAHLLDAHGRGRRTVVIVDEAQHLAADVLEQMRLLTNLETAKAKLLQIILVGQPELVALLQRTDLRQVAQRVAARYHLMPLAEHETRAYVLHRLAMAGQTTALFDEAAVRAVHRASGGVPRLVNVLCDRALLGAYAVRGSHVTAAIVRRAAREVAGETPAVRPRARRRVAAMAAAAGVIVAAAAGLFASAASPPPPPAAATAPVAVVAAPAPPPEPSLAALLDDPAVASDADTAYAAVAARWGATYERRAGESPCDAVRRSGLQCIARRGTWNVVRRFDVPAVLELGSPSAARRYVAVTSIDDRHATVDLGARRERLSVDEIAREWDGGFVVLWKPPHAGVGAIGPGASGADVAWLRQRLDALDGRPGPAAAAPERYDGSLAARIAAFQGAHGLLPDGIAGSETLARLTAILDPAAPSLARPAPRS